MKSLAVLISLAALMLVGCHKKQVASAGQQPAPTDSAAPEVSSGQPQEQVATTPRPAPPPKALPPPPLSISTRADNYVRDNVVGEVDASLTAELRNFIEKKSRMPQSFAEFANVRLDSVPTPPEGKKWVIDGANLQVKAVAK